MFWIGAVLVCLLAYGLAALVRPDLIGGRRWLAAGLVVPCALALSPMPIPALRAANSTTGAPPTFSTITAASTVRIINGARAAVQARLPRSSDQLRIADDRPRFTRVAWTVAQAPAVAAGRGFAAASPATAIPPGADTADGAAGRHAGDGAMGAAGGQTGDIAALMALSDDYHLHAAAFVRAAETLIAGQVCSEADFREVGGWIRSSLSERAEVYFTYCGGFRPDNHVALNVRTGTILR